jgi:hypothetical protein
MALGADDRRRGRAPRLGGTQALESAAKEVVTAMDDVERAMLEQRVMQLKIEHRDLDDVIKRLGEQLVYDQLQLQRLKRRKLLLKDQISWLERQVDPDIPA